MTVREIRDHLKGLYDVDVSPDLGRQWHQYGWRTSRLGVCVNNLAQTMTKAARHRLTEQQPQTTEITAYAWAVPLMAWTPADEPFLEIPTAMGVTVVVAVIFIIFVVIVASSTTLGRAVLPDAVVDVAARLLPHALITDASATLDGEFQLKVKGGGEIKEVSVHRNSDRTTAWAFNPGVDCPQSGSFTFDGLEHHAEVQDPTLSAAKVQQRIEAALTAVLSKKQFRRADMDSGDIGIRATAILTDFDTLSELSSSRERQNSPEWQAALSTALRAEGDDGMMTIVSGSLLLSVINSRTHETIWHAASIGEIVVDVSEAERERRIYAAIEQMLKRFPPSPPESGDHPSATTS